MTYRVGSRSTMYEDESDCSWKSRRTAHITTASKYAEPSLMKTTCVLGYINDHINNTISPSLLQSSLVQPWTSACYYTDVHGAAYMVELPSRVCICTACYYLLRKSSAVSLVFQRQISGENFDSAAIVGPIAYQLITDVTARCYFQITTPMLPSYLYN